MCMYIYSVGILEQGAVDNFVTLERKIGRRLQQCTSVLRRFKICLFHKILGANQ